jgi:hypothetical protein
MFDLKRQFIVLSTECDLDVSRDVLFIRKDQPSACFRDTQPRRQGNPDR